MQQSLKSQLPPSHSRNSKNFMEPEFRYPVNKSLPLVPILSQINPVHTVSSCLLSSPLVRGYLENEQIIQHDIKAFFSWCLNDIPDFVYTDWKRRRLRLLTTTTTNWWLIIIIAVILNQQPRKPTNNSFLRPSEFQTRTYTSNRSSMLLKYTLDQKPNQWIAFAWQLTQIPTGASARISRVTCSKFCGSEYVSNRL
jgi:hypothetical protein